MQELEGLVAVEEEAQTAIVACYSGSLRRLKWNESLTATHESVRMLHYTNQDGWNSIRSQVDWLFRAHQPPGVHPFGAYFTTLTPETRNLAKRLRIPRSKIEFVFCFRPNKELVPLEGGRGEYIWYSPTDYSVGKQFQDGNGRSDEGACS